ncbi:MAG: hypothetical protein ACR2K3_10515 [Nocardioides sp.]
MLRFVLVTVVVAVVTYLLVRKMLMARHDHPEPPPTRPWAPDDDDAFLAELDHRRRPDKG